MVLYTNEGRVKLFMASAPILIKSISIGHCLCLLGHEAVFWGSMSAQLRFQKYSILLKHT